MKYLLVSWSDGGRDGGPGLLPRREAVGRRDGLRACARKEKAREPRERTTGNSTGNMKLTTGNSTELQSSDNG